MSEFGITAVSYNRAHTQIARCILHTIEQVAGRLVISEGRDVPYTDVYALIEQGEGVWIVYDPLPLLSNSKAANRACAVPICRSKLLPMNTQPPSENLWSVEHAPSAIQQRVLLQREQDRITLSRTFEAIEESLALLARRRIDAWPFYSEIKRP